MTYRYCIYDALTDTRIRINPEYLQQLIALYVHAMLEEEE